MSTEHLTQAQRDMLVDVADTESVGGISLRFVARGHRDLEALDLLYINGTRVRCTPEGLEAAREVREREDG